VGRVKQGVKGNVLAFRGQPGEAHVRATKADSGRKMDCCAVPRRALAERPAAPERQRHERVGRDDLDDRGVGVAGQALQRGGALRQGWRPPPAGPPTSTSSAA